MADPGPSDVPTSRRARPTFASQVVSQPRPTLLFVDSRAPKSKEEKRKIRAQVMFASHETRRRRGLHSHEADEKIYEKSQDAKSNVNTLTRVRRERSPLEDVVVASADPFDSLPVKTFPVMHDLISYYFDQCPLLPLVDDMILKKQDKEQGMVIRRSNTVWDVMSMEEESLLVVLAELARFRFTMNPDSEWRTTYLTLRERSLRSMRERLASWVSKNQWNISDAYVTAIAGMASAADLYGEKEVALSHLAAARELARLKGGIETLERVARRTTTWSVLQLCTAHDILPAFAPAPPAPSAANPPDTPSPFPLAFRSAVAAARVRTRARLPQPCHHMTSSSAATTPTSSTLDTVFHALHLISFASSPTWHPAIMADAAAKDGLASVFDDAGYTLRVDVVRFGGGSDNEHRDVEDKDGEAGDTWGASGSKCSCECWLNKVVLHAAEAYLWTVLSHMPPGAQANAVLLERLQRALSLEGAVEEERVGSGGGDTRAALARCGHTEVLMWSLVVGWFLADKILVWAMSENDQVRMAAGGGRLLGWFEDRIWEFLESLGVGAKERATAMVMDFPGTDEFRMKWHCLLLKDGHCWWQC